MKVDVFSIAGAKKGQVSLPGQFDEPVRTDLIRRAVLAQRTHSYQIHGVDPMAGKRQGDAMPKARKKFKGTYGKSISRVARKVMSRSGLQFNWVGAFITNAVGGRKAFPPLAEKIVEEQINRKERRKAIRSAIAASAVKTIVSGRGHRIEGVKEVPLLVEDKIEGLKKAKEVRETFVKLGLEKEMERVSVRKVRAGRGKMRGRIYKHKVGPLLVVSKPCDVVKAARNLPGVDVSQVCCLSAELLAPGTHAGRLTIWTESAIERLGKERLFE